MAFRLGDRVRETSATTGTGALTLAGAVAGYRAFSAALSTGDTTYYTIAMADGSFESGIGTFTAPSTLARTTVLESSNANAAVNFGAGTKDVFIALPAAIVGANFDGRIAKVPSDTKGSVSSGTVTFDATRYGASTLTNAGAHTWAFTWPASGYAPYQVLVENAGAFPITLPAGIRWRKGDGTYSTTFSDQGVTLQAAAPNEFGLWTFDGGSTVYGKAF